MKKVHRSLPVAHQSNATNLPSNPSPTMKSSFMYMVTEIQEPEALTTVINPVRLWTGKSKDPYSTISSKVLNSSNVKGKTDPKIDSGFVDVELHTSISSYNNNAIVTDDKDVRTRRTDRSLTRVRSSVELVTPVRKIRKNDSKVMMVKKFPSRQSTPSSLHRMIGFSSDEILASIVPLKKADSKYDDRKQLGKLNEQRELTGKKPLPTPRLKQPSSQLQAPNLKFSKQQQQPSFQIQQPQQQQPYLQQKVNNEQQQPSIQNFLQLQQPQLQQPQLQQPQLQQPQLQQLQLQQPQLQQPQLQKPQLTTMPNNILPQAAPQQLTYQLVPQPETTPATQQYVSQPQHLKLVQQPLQLSQTQNPISTQQQQTPNEQRSTSPANRWHKKYLGEFKPKRGKKIKKIRERIRTKTFSKRKNHHQKNQTKEKSTSSSSSTGSDKVQIKTGSKLSQNPKMSIIIQKTKNPDVDIKFKKFSNKHKPDFKSPFLNQATTHIKSSLNERESTDFKNQMIKKLKMKDALDRKKLKRIIKSLETIATGGGMENASSERILFNDVFEKKSPPKKKKSDPKIREKIVFLEIKESNPKPKSKEVKPIKKGRQLSEIETTESIKKLVDELREKQNAKAKKAAQKVKTKKKTPKPVKTVKSPPKPVKIKSTKLKLDSADEKKLKSSFSSMTTLKTIYKLAKKKKTEWDKKRQQIKSQPKPKPKTKSKPKKKPKKPTLSKPKNKPVKQKSILKNKTSHNSRSTRTSNWNNSSNFTSMESAPPTEEQELNENESTGRRLSPGMFRMDPLEDKNISLMESIAKYAGKYERLKSNSHAQLELADKENRERMIGMLLESYERGISRKEGSGAYEYYHQRNKAKPKERLIVSHIPRESPLKHFY
ncbi:hypothetical protein HELRODRAFT_175379 [Helobdella robusta]|uniref:Uncharacterized protein n=1 Tax=Helobdella robusta TaxID=6412 RepID=T1F979_HELRO|nr:hypothetical protein HELRODRAFT_175379 [Helobdella robusta]ESO00883.1 hypothetical protein HELRODRAFT_175379 [Helobdella robusta]